MAEYYHNLITQKSFELLKQLRRDYKFILIGGWAVFLLTKTLKSKDIDVVVDFSELEKIREAHEVLKNERLKKYEIKIDEIDVDIYVYHYSSPGLPAEEINQYTLSREGFTIPRPEILLILKQAALRERQGTPKGEKDKIDIFSLLTETELDFDFYKNVLQAHHREELTEDLRGLVMQTRAVKELNINEYKFSQLKKRILREI